MSQPIKVSDELYKRLKERAQADGGTLQDALVSLLTKPLEQLRGLRAELHQTQSAASELKGKLKRLETEFTHAKSQSVHCSALTDELAKLRGKDNEVFNSWTDTWNLVPELEKRLEELDERISKLEIFKHRHIGQAPRS
ncbi:hypothetical protein KAX14_03015 [Candidatus Bipolaricaulota bacterium]|nr:hypothetical protein [Candidatus Bipolaricaulota bacterium]